VISVGDVAHPKYLHAVSEGKAPVPQGVDRGAMMGANEPADLRKA
jgi:hypothetical protein